MTAAVCWPAAGAAGFGLAARTAGRRFAGADGRSGRRGGGRQLSAGSCSATRGAGFGAGCRGGAAGFGLGRAGGTAGGACRTGGGSSVRAICRGGVAGRKSIAAPISTISSARPVTASDTCFRRRASAVSLSDTQGHGPCRDHSARGTAAARKAFAKARAEVNLPAASGSIARRRKRNAAGETWGREASASRAARLEAVEAFFAAADG